MRDEDVAVAAGIGIGVLLLATGKKGGAKEEVMVAPRTTPLQSEVIAGWRWPLPTIALGTDGVRVDSAAPPAIEVVATVSQAFRPPDHEGVDICYRRPAGSLPSLRTQLPYSRDPLAERVVDAVRPTVYRTIEQWTRDQDAAGEWRQRYAAGYLPRQVIGGSSTPGGATPGEWADSRAGTRAHFCPPSVLCVAVADGRLWAAGESARGFFVLVDHGSYTTYYAHLSSLAVPRAANGLVSGTKTQLRVTAGMALGVVGYDPSAPNTVRHLHLQMAHYPGGVRRVVDAAPSLARATRWR